MTRLEQLALRDVLLDLEPLRLPTSLTALLVDRRVAVRLLNGSQPAAKRVHTASHSCLGPYPPIQLAQRHFMR